MDRTTYDMYGAPRWAQPIDTSGMHDPVRCAHCTKVYDLAAVTVTARYMDCSMWKCPGCQLTVDDRGETGCKSRQDYYRLRREGG